jgi:hypothetical protein
MDINKSIGCNVHECKYHAGTQHYCTLNDIMVTHHVEPAKTKENTDCESFEAKQS